MRGRLFILPLTVLSTLEISNNIWNIVKIGWGRDNRNHEVLSSGILQVYYPKGSYSPSKNPQGGIGFYASPKDVFPTNEVELRYQVKFDKTFNPNLGGKLPGLFLSTSTKKEDMSSGSGGKNSNTTASIRIAWRQNFTAEAYLYLPKIQAHEYKKTNNVISNGKYGDSVWRNLFQFNKETWNTVIIYAKVNTFKDEIPKTDGVLRVTINNTTQTFDQLIWRMDNNTLITSILFSTFFGGSTYKYATPNDTWVYFKNVSLR
jgi:hypothetical protein